MRHEFDSLFLRSSFDTIMKTPYTLTAHFDRLSGTRNYCNPEEVIKEERQGDIFLIDD